MRRRNHRPTSLRAAPSCSYRFIAFPPIAPRIAEATAITTFKMVSQTVFLIAIVKSCFKKLYIILKK